MLSAACGACPYSPVRGLVLSLVDVGGSQHGPPARDGLLAAQRQCHDRATAHVGHELLKVILILVFLVELCSLILCQTHFLCVSDLKAARPDLAYYLVCKDTTV